jgi:NAD(P)-dependent dehydrogenase (short-subunit alcohol dehydrogenase family)
VIVHGRRARAVSAAAEANSADGGQAESLTADQADPGDCARLISGALAGGDPDSLVNNAGASANRGPCRHYGQHGQPRHSRHAWRTGVLPP